MLLVFFALSASYSFGQRKKDEKIVLPTDSSTNLITFQEVIKVEGVSKDELYLRAREWFARTFVSSQEVIQMDDKQGGKIIGKGVSSGSYSIMLSPILYYLNYTVSVTVKDGRYRYEISPFTIEGTSPDGLYTVYRSGEKGIKYSISKKVIPHVKLVGESLSESLKVAMNTMAVGVKSKDDF